MNQRLQVSIFTTILYYIFTTVLYYMTRLEAAEMRFLRSVKG